MSKEVLIAVCAVNLESCLNASAEVVPLIKTNATEALP
jgi:hypothetical protein